MVKVTIDASCLKDQGSGTAYDDTEVLNRIKALEGRTDNFVSEVTVSREGNKVKLTYTRVDGTSSEVEFDDKDTISIAYDDTALKERVTALEAREDKDTVYDDTALKQRVDALENKVDNDTVYDDTEVKNRLTALEAKEDSDKQTLTLTGNELSISNGNSVNLPEVELKTYEVTSDTEGVVVTKAEAGNTVTHNVNLDNALDKYYKKAETYTKQEVDNLMDKQEKKATDITVYRGTFTDKTKVKEGENDVAISPRVTLTYSSSTGVGIFKIDFKVVSSVSWSTIIAELPANSPVPAELVEAQVWVGNNSTSVWIDKGSRSVRIFGVNNPEMFNKRIILSIPGIFKK